jgi:deoxyadenosine/deoxycytidine kinase
VAELATLRCNCMTTSLDQMMSEIETFPKKAPDVMVYLHGSFATVFKRIQTTRTFLRTRSKSFVDYYQFLWKDYDDWVYHSYKESPIIDIDVDQKNIIYNKDDKQWLLDQLTKISGKTPLK